MAERSDAGSAAAEGSVDKVSCILILLLFRFRPILGFLLTLRLSFKRNVYELIVCLSRFVNSFTKEDWRKMS